MLVSDEKRKRTCATLNGGCKKFARNAFLGGRAVQPFSRFGLRFGFLCCAPLGRLFLWLGSGGRAPKNRLTHGKESQCAKRLNNGLPKGGAWENGLLPDNHAAIIHFLVTIGNANNIHASWHSACREFQVGLI